MDFTNEAMLHPITSHFPIVFIVLALVFKLASNFSDKFDFSYRLMLYSAPVAMIVTLFFGDLALESVKAKLCSYRTAVMHESMADMTIYFLIACILCEILITSKKLKETLHNKIVNLIGILFLITANYYLVQTAHLGGKLVYKYGTGVENARCK